jgi:hypothetical protein
MPSAAKWTRLTSEQLKDMDSNAIEKADPERYKAIVKMLQLGMSIRGTAEAAGCSHTTVYRIMMQDESMQKGITALSAKLQKNAHQSLDRMVEMMDDPELRDKISYKDLAVSTAVVTDKIEKLSQSQAPQHLHVTQINVNETASINDLIDSLPSAAPKQQPQSIDVQQVVEENSSN